MFGMLAVKKIAILLLITLLILYNSEIEHNANLANRIQIIHLKIEKPVSNAEFRLKINDFT